MTSDANFDADALVFDAMQVTEGGERGWFKNSFSHLDTQLITKDTGVSLSSKGAKLELSWGQYGANLLQNPGFETGAITGWTDKGTTPATVSGAQIHGGSHAVGGTTGGHELYQDVDISSLAPFVDRARARIDTGIWLSSVSAAGDSGRFVASFHFESSSSLDSYDTGLVKPATWTQYQNERIVTKGIRRVRAWHQCSGASCYADDAVVRLKLQRYPTTGSVVYGRTFQEAVTWGVLSWSGILPPGTSIACSVRTSANGLGGWGAWSRVATNTDDISSLPGVTDGHKAIEIKFELGSTGVNSPTITSFLLNY